MKKQLSIISLGLLMCIASSSEPVLRSYNDQTMDFEQKDILLPADLERLQAQVREASDSGKKLRLSGNSHSVSSVIVGEGSYLKTTKLNHIGEIQNNGNETTITVEAGVQLGELSDYLHKQGYSLGFAFPAYRGLTIGGLTATGSHGSSRTHTAVSSQLIREISLVKADGSLVTLDANQPDAFKAAKVSLGLLGAVYKIKLKIEPEFHLRMVTEPLEGGKSLLSEKGKVNWGPVADYESIAWFPHDDKAVKFSGHKTTEPATPASGENVTLGASDKVTIGSHVVNLVLKWGRRWPFLNQLAENVRRKGLSSSPPFVHMENGKEVAGDAVVGSSNKMLLSREGGLSPLFTQQDISFAFPETQAHEVLTTIREFSKKNNYRLPLIGVYFRFAHADGGSFLSHIERPGSAGKLFVLAEFMEYKSYGVTKMPHTRRDSLQKELMELLIKKHAVTFHWGKNSDDILKRADLQTAFGENLDRALKVVKTMDPKGIFQTEFMSDLLLSPVACKRFYGY